MVAAYAAHFGLEWKEADALAFAHQRGGRSGRIAWHYAVELAGRAGRSL
jgi:predicted AAA+ superfamily ATPase